MKLNPTTIDPTRLLKPTSVALRLAVHASMVTHWLAGGQLDYVAVDGVKFIPEQSVAVLESMRSGKTEARKAKQEAVELATLR